jgi:glyoxalase/bleomycin resistance protein/dioxygenase superfamily protein
MHATALTTGLPCAVEPGGNALVSTAERRGGSCSAIACHLYCADLDAALGFYRELLGFTETFRYPARRPAPGMTDALRPEGYGWLLERTR